MGIANNNPKSVIAPFPAFFELLPVSEEYSAINCEINENFKSNAKNLQVFPFGEGLIIMPVFQIAFTPVYKHLYFKSAENTTVNAFIDGFPKIMVLKEDRANIFPLPFLPKFFKAEICKNALALLIKNEFKERALLINLEEMPKLKAIKKVNDVKIVNEEIYLYYKKLGIRSLCYFEKLDTNFNVLSEELQESAPISALSPYLLPFAFLEELILNKDISEFLHPELQKHKNIIKRFFGNFFTFIPWLENNEVKAVIISDKAKLVHFELKNNLISDFYFDDTF